MNKKVTAIIEFFIGIVILCVLIIKIGIKKIIVILSNADPLYIFYALILLIIVLVMGGINIYLLLKILKPKIRSNDIIFAYLKNWVLSQILPFRVSGISMVIILKMIKIKIKDSIAVILVDKIITFIIMFLLGFIGIIYFIPQKNILIYAILFLLIIIILGFITFSKKSDKIISFLSNKIKLKGISGFSKKSNIIIKSKNVITINIALTLVKLIFTAIIPYIIITGYNIHPNIIQFLFISILVSIISSIPITNAGLGIRETSAVALFAIFMDIDKVVIAGTYLLFLLIKYAFSLLFILFYYGIMRKQ